MDISLDKKTWEKLKKSPLFEGLNDQQIHLLFSICTEVHVAADEVIIHENEISSDVFILKEGEVEITKFDREESQTHRLGCLKEGVVIGEVALIDNAPRSATVKTTKPSIFYVLDIKKLRAQDEQLKRVSARFKNLPRLLLGKETPKPILPIIMQNIAKQITSRIRSANVVAVDAIKSDLIQTKARIAMGKLIIYTFILLSIYIFVMNEMERLHTMVATTTFVSVPLIIALTIPLFYMILDSGYPLSMYGLTLKHWKRAVLEAIIFTIPLLLVIVLYKWVLIKFSPEFAHRKLFDFTLSLTKQDNAATPYWFGASLVALYLLFVPIQELITRGILQSSFQILFIGEHKTFWAIILSNILFGDFHSHVSVRLGLVVLIPGLFWGWLYARQHTLVGVIVSHLIVGAWALYMVALL